MRTIDLITFKRQWQPNTLNHCDRTKTILRSIQIECSEIESNMYFWHCTERTIDVIKFKRLWEVNTLNH